MKIPLYFDEDSILAHFLLLTRVSSMRMQRPLGREEQVACGFDAPRAVVYSLVI